MEEQQTEGQMTRWGCSGAGMGQVVRQVVVVEGPKQMEKFMQVIHSGGVDLVELPFAIRFGLVCGTGPRWQDGARQECGRDGGKEVEVEEGEGWRVGVRSQKH